MDNERLRKFIDEIGDCRYVSDKIAMVKQDIHSMKDLIEVLNIGFWGEECITLFDTLGDPEIGLLLQFVRSHPPEWRSDSGWEQQLMKYTRHS
jgi:hypothetical protein